VIYFFYFFVIYCNFFINYGNQKIIERTTKVKIFNSNVKTMLFYASESWTIIRRATEIEGDQRIGLKAIWRKKWGPQVSGRSGIRWRLESAAQDSVG